MDDKIYRALRSLPREQAGPYFTEGVLRRLERRPPQPLAAARWPLLATAAVLTLVVALGAREWWHLHHQRQITARLQTLETERQALAAELRELQHLTAEARPVVYLGGDNDLDLVLDLARLRQAGIRPDELPRDFARAARLWSPERGAAGLQPLDWPELPESSGPWTARPWSAEPWTAGAQAGGARSAEDRTDIRAASFERPPTVF